jgi:demethylmenaquinone methyltransferase/2-methoxy-6-polyprenyl-1,4-benzoquinol methylase
MDALHLKAGDEVIEIACRTGLNFSLYQKAIGPHDKITGIDLTDANLVQAQRPIEVNAW